MNILSFCLGDEIYEMDEMDDEALKGLIPEDKASHGARSIEIRTSYCAQAVIWLLAAGFQVGKIALKLPIAIILELINGVTNQAVSRRVRSSWMLNGVCKDGHALLGLWNRAKESVLNILSPSEEGLPINKVIHQASGIVDGNDHGVDETDGLILLPGTE